MYLHCAPPYRRDIPNPALGYLKGFLQSKGVPVQNVYWNLILDEEMQALQNFLGNYRLIPTLYRTYLGPLYTIKKLCGVSSHTTLDALFSLCTTAQEREKITESVISKIDKTLHTMTDPIHGFTVKTHQWLLMHYIIQRLKKLNPETTIIVGGIINEEQGRTYMDVFDYIDYVVWGEGETPLYRLVTTQDVHHVPNILYRDRTTVKSTYSYIPSDVDSHPFADHSDYFAAVQHMEDPPHVLLPIWGSRSCPWNKCKFCVVNEEYTFRVRSPQNIVKEIEFQSEKHHVDTFAFMDSDIASNMQRFKQLLTCIVESAEKRGRPYHIYAETSPLFITDETALLMQKASFDLVQIGFEAVTDPLLKKMQKRHGMVHNIQALKLGAKYNLDVKGNVMGGIPPETREDVQESLRNIIFLRFFLKRTPVMYRPFSLYKGSAFYDEMSESELKEWNKDILWEEIVGTGLIPEENRFDFFSFYPTELCHYMLWDTFKRLLALYNRIESSYSWEEYSNCSVLTEKGVKNHIHVLDRDKTDVLIYCDTVKSFEQVYTQFSFILEDDLYRKIHLLKEEGLLYTDGTAIISLLEAAERKIHSEPFIRDDYQC